MQQILSVYFMLWMGKIVFVLTCSDKTFIGVAVVLGHVMVSEYYKQLGVGVSMTAI